MNDKQQTENEIVDALDYFVTKCECSHHDDEAKKKAYDELFVFNLGLLCGLKLKAKKNEN